MRSRFGEFVSGTEGRTMGLGVGISDAIIMGGKNAGGMITMML